MNLSNQNNQTKTPNVGTPNGKYGADKHAIHNGVTNGLTTGKADVADAQSPATTKAGTPANNFQKNGPGGAPPAGKNGEGDTRKNGSPSGAAEAAQTSTNKSGSTTGGKPADKQSTDQNHQGQQHGQHGHQGQQNRNQSGKNSGEVAQPAKGGREADADAKTDSKSDPKADSTNSKVAGAHPEVQAMDNESPAAARSAKADKKSEVDQKKDGAKALTRGGNGVSEANETEAGDDEMQSSSNAKAATSGQDDEDADRPASQNGRATDKKNQPKVEVPQHKKQGQGQGQGSSNRK